MGEAIKFKGKMDVERVFDCYCKVIMRNRFKDYKREKDRIEEKEISIEIMSPKELFENGMITEDKYFAQTIEVNGEAYTIYNFDLKEALEVLSEDRFLVICYYYLYNMTDEEIGKKLGYKRCTVRYKRVTALELLKKCMER